MVILCIPKQCDRGFDPQLEVMTEEYPLAHVRINFLCGDVDSELRAFLKTKEEEARTPAPYQHNIEPFGGSRPPVEIMVVYTLDASSVLRMSGVNKSFKSLCDEDVKTCVDET